MGRGMGGRWTWVSVGRHGAGCGCSVSDPLPSSPQVHEEFKQNVENIGVELLLRRFAESKGTGQERPGVGHRGAAGG